MNNNDEGNTTVKMPSGSPGNDITGYDLYVKEEGIPKLQQIRSYLFTDTRSDRAHRAELEKQELLRKMWYHVPQNEKHRWEGAAAYRNSWNREATKLAADTAASEKTSSEQKVTTESLLNTTTSTTNDPNTTLILDMASIPSKT